MPKVVTRSYAVRQSCVVQGGNPVCLENRKMWFPVEQASWKTLKVFKLDTLPTYAQSGKVYHILH